MELVGFTETVLVDETLGLLSVLLSQESEVRWGQEQGLADIQSAINVAIVVRQEDARVAAGSKTLGLRVKLN